jgi:hypothetical protein
LTAESSKVILKRMGKKHDGSFCAPGRLPASMKRRLILFSAAAHVLLFAGTSPAQPYEELGEFRLASDGMGPPLYDSYGPSLAAISGGRYLAVWRFDRRYHEYGLKAAILDADGRVLEDVAINDCLEPEGSLRLTGVPAVAASGSGSFVVWSPGYYSYDGHLLGAYVSDDGEVTCRDLSALGYSSEYNAVRIAPAPSGYRMAWIWNESSLYTALLDDSGEFVPESRDIVALLDSGGYGLQSFDVCPFGPGHVIAYAHETWDSSTFQLSYVDEADGVSEPASWVNEGESISGISLAAKGGEMGVAVVGFGHGWLDIKAFPFSVEGGSPLVLDPVRLLAEDQFYDFEIHEPFGAGLIGGDLAALWVRGDCGGPELVAARISESGVVENPEGALIGRFEECCNVNRPDVASGPVGSLIAWEGECGFYDLGDVQGLRVEAIRSISGLALDAEGRPCSERQYVSLEQSPLFNPRGRYVPDEEIYILEMEGYGDVRTAGSSSIPARAVTAFVRSDLAAGAGLMPALPCSDGEGSAFAPEPILLESYPIVLSDLEFPVGEGWRRVVSMSRMVLLDDEARPGPCLHMYGPEDPLEEYGLFAADSNGKNGVAAMVRGAAAPEGEWVGTGIERVRLSGGGEIYTRREPIETGSESVIDIAVSASLDGSRFFIAWIGISGEGDERKHRLMGMMVDGEGSPVTDVFQMLEYDAGTVDAASPVFDLVVAPAGDGGFVVVFMDAVIIDSGALRNRLVSVAVSKDGEVGPGDPPEIGPDSPNEHDPKIIFDGRNVAAAWLELSYDEDSTVYPHQDIMLTLLDGGGEPTGDAPFRVNDEDEFVHGVDLVRGPGQVMVLYEYGDRAFEERSVYVKGKIFSVPDQPPDIDAGGPYRVTAGDAVLLAASASDPDGDAFTVGWDLDGDGIFDDGSGLEVTFATTADMAGRDAAVRVKAADSFLLESFDEAVVHVQGFTDDVPENDFPADDSPEADGPADAGEAWEGAGGEAAGCSCKL